VIPPMVPLVHKLFSNSWFLSTLSPSLWLYHCAPFKSLFFLLPPFLSWVISQWKLSHHLQVCLLSLSFFPILLHHLFLPPQFWRTPKLLDGLNCESKGEDNEKRKIWGSLPGSQHFEGRKVCLSFGMGLRRMTSNLITHMDFHKPNNKLVSA